MEIDNKVMKDWDWDGTQTGRGTMEEMGEIYSTLNNKSKK